MSFRSALNLDCGHDPAACNCFTSSTATQSLEELEFARSACQAASSGQVEKLRRILERAPDAVHSDGGKGTSGYTPLHYAARAGQSDCAALLLKHGAAVDARTVQGRATPLHRAAHAGSLPMVKLLVRSGANGLLQDSDGETSLHKAAAEGHLEVVRFLGDAFPAAALLKDRKDKTPRERATGEGVAAALLAIAAERGGPGAAVAEVTKGGGV